MTKRKPALFSALIIIEMLVILFFTTSCHESNGTNNSPRISDIINNPLSFEGQEVTIEGKFGGWSLRPDCDYDKIAMRTRSDFIIYDGSGCLYMTGNYQVINGDLKLKEVGSDIKVKGIIKIIDGKPILD